MFNLVSLIIGVVALIFAVVAFIPLLGWLNWLIIAQRDYLEWIAEAKQEATRQKRIATAIEWLGEGKRRHWKYESC
jgi:hypothetical protein